MSATIEQSEYFRALVDLSNDACPRCAGELDTGWECNVCGYDAMPLTKLAHDWVETHAAEIEASERARSLRDWLLTAFAFRVKARQDEADGVPPWE